MHLGDDSQAPDSQRLTLTMLL
ncbi:hypothetical protein RV134_310099 [Roseovarius sp. EC-HK134]|nr:hypothetical protein RV134_310099 [Roseovarius sp. EC-HK134]